MTKIKGEWTK